MPKEEKIFIRGDLNEHMQSNNNDFERVPGGHTLGSRKHPYVISWSREKHIREYSKEIPMLGVGKEGSFHSAYKCDKGYV